MSKIKNLVVLFAAIAAAIGLFSIFNLDSKNSEVKFSPDAPQPQQQTKSEPPVEVQPAPAFAGQDPFKEFLEKQKQNSKDQVVSPFGKN